MASVVSIFPRSIPKEEANEPSVPPIFELLFTSGAKLRLDVYVRGIQRIYAQERTNTIGNTI